MSTIDLNTPPPSHNFKVSVQPDETRAEVLVRLLKDLILFAVAIGFVGIVAWICLDTLRSAEASADEKRWAQSVISAATGGIIGYLIRR